MVLRSGSEEAQDEDEENGDEDEQDSNKLTEAAAQEDAGLEEEAFDDPEEAALLAEAEAMLPDIQGRSGKRVCTIYSSNRPRK